MPHLVGAVETVFVGGQGAENDHHRNEGEQAGSNRNHQKHPEQGLLAFHQNPILRARLAVQQWRDFTPKMTQGRLVGRPFFSTLPDIPVGFKRYA